MDDDTVLVCGRVRASNRYALPFGPGADQAAPRMSERDRQMEAVREAWSPCAMHSNACEPPAAVDIPTLLAGVFRFVKGLREKD